MGTTLYCFTGTGNSLWLARALAGRLGPDAEVVGIPAALAAGGDRIAPSGEVVGLVFPVYAFCPPRMVEAFLQRLDVPAGAYVFAVADAASVAGSAMRRLERCLRARDMALDGGWILKMPGNYPVLYGAEPDAKQARKFAAAREALDRIADDIRQRRRGAGNRGVPPLTWLAGLFAGMRDRMQRNVHARFVADQACTGCGRCARLCPAGVIRLVDGRPQWSAGCEQCMACIQWCPVEAIQIGAVTRGRKRYHRPEITHEDILANNRPGTSPAAEGVD